MRILKKILKRILFLIVSVVIGIIPAWCCVFVGSFVLLLFGVEVSETTGNIILCILTALIGMYLTGEMIGKI